MIFLKENCSLSNKSKYNQNTIKQNLKKSSRQQNGIDYLTRENGKRDGKNHIILEEPNNLTVLTVEWS